MDRPTEHRQCGQRGHGNWAAGNSDQYRNRDESDNADITVDGCCYSMSNEPMSN